MGRLEQLIERGPVLFDGAMGTELNARGVPVGHCLEEVNLEQPALVLAVHRDYIAAGADVIETNTFRANRFGLGDFYLEDRVREINLAAARIASEARNNSGRPVLVAGSIGPLGRPIEPVGAIKRSSAERIFGEQVQALAEGGVDLLVLETFTALGELEAAVEAARATAPHPPVVAHLSFDDEATPAQAAAALVRALEPLHVTGIGANCGSGPYAALEVTTHLVAAGARHVSVMPNAGLPQRVGGRLVYSTGPHYFAEVAERLVSAGARFVGGCCGTGPAHIAGVREQLTSAGDSPRSSARRRRPADQPDTEAAPRSRLAREMGLGRVAVSVGLT